MLTSDQRLAYERDGFVLVNDVFKPDEIEILSAAAGQGKQVMNMPDANGRSSKLALWTDISPDVFGLVSTSPRMVGGARAILGEDVYHWHSKVMMKEPRVGGAWEWHQDYGYWYNDGCLYPRMISCMLALDDATRENGCLKVLTGSHHLGRIDHGRRGGQAGADPERVAAIEARLPVYYCQARAGSVLFFHGNLLHASEANLSDRPRRAFICCYNALSNAPYGGKGHGKPEPINLAEDGAILKFATAQTAS